MFRYTQGDAKVSCLPLKRCTENENYAIKGMTKSALIYIVGVTNWSFFFFSELSYDLEINAEVGG